MLDSLVKQVAQQGREASLVLYLLVTLVFLALALHKEWLVLGKSAKRDRDSCESKGKALDDINAKLVDQRILNERATVIIESQRTRIADLELDLAKAEGRQWQSRGQKHAERSRL
jgi:hypothetical protein